jgi:hypothetical protein
MDDVTPPNALNAEQVRMLDELLSSIESDIIDAGESCPANYQSGFDWLTYQQMLDTVKLRILEFTLTLLNTRK